MVAVRGRFELLEKNKPQQERAKRTYEAILYAAAELLVEVGVERISTNIIAQKAGITVPALYRYFPNKYAVLSALGASCMDKQNAVFQFWLDQYSGQSSPELLLGDFYSLLSQTYDVTQEQVSGLQVVQALRAVAPLRDVRLASRRLISSRFATVIAELLGRKVDELLITRARLTIDSAFTIVEMAMEEPSVPTESLLREGARMIQLYWQDVLYAE